MATVIIAAPTSVQEGDSTFDVNLIFQNVSSFSAQISSQPDASGTASVGADWGGGSSSANISVSQSPPGDYVYEMGTFSIVDDATDESTEEIAIRITLGGGHTFSNGQSTGILTVQLLDNEAVFGSNDPATGDVLTGDARRDTFLGLAGDDIVLGDGGNDTLDGGLGSDQIGGGTGSDVLRDGGADADGVRDFMYGESGSDTYHVTSSIASVLAGGLDIVDEGEGNPSLPGSPSDSDTIVSHGEFFWDFYSVGETLRIAESAAGATTYLVGGKNTDAQIFGNSGSNIISAYGGSNTVDAGPGTDAISFGLYDLDESFDGVNTLVMRPGTGIDYLYDFESGTDKVDLRPFNFGISGQEVLDQGINVVDADPSTPDYCYFFLTNAGGVDNFAVFVGLTTGQLQAGDFIV